ncbi:sensor histidine kinase [Adhaeribacter soli]|uniref:histidine kinase n=1 Tax=Adhaeribacter soli TaxID=2607655 RepID=A0A5N1J5W7_9BACT|nr:ATP-binding protein [Adhaeribacter soli]KAA9345563.1 ATP-binding protein [Adhaeribacter soli]
MIIKHIGVGLLVRVSLLFGMLNAVVYALHHLFLPQVLTASAIVLGQLWELVRYLTRSNEELARFLQSIKNRDFSLQFTEKNTRSDLPQLHQAFNQLNQTFTQLHIEKEAQFQLLQSILQIIDTGIIAYDETGEVHWVNEAFKQTIHLPHLRNIQALEVRQETLYQTLKKLQPNENQLIKLKVDQNPLQLLVSARSFKMQHKNLTLAALKNVGTTIDKAETEAWQKLLRVMTHEIMNSVAPISSLAETMLKHLKLNREALAGIPEPQADPELFQDVEEGLEVIQNRSEGLLKFAQIYRNLSKVTDLHLTTVYVQELFRAITSLLKPRLEQKNIKLLVELSNQNLTLQADPYLLEQVLINLMVNAERAVREKPEPIIKLSCRQTENGSIVMEVADNGTGIPEELLDSIFIPFFTSHKDGSGIGLSLAKQIMTLHKGSIRVNSVVGEGTVFSLQF